MPNSSRFQTKQRKLRKVTQRVAAMSETELDALHKMLTSGTNKLIAPPPEVAGKVWAMIDSGAEPNVANCRVVFPHHQIHESAAQKAGVQYKGADGTLIANEGEIHMSHREKAGAISPCLPVRAPTFTVRS